MHHLYIQEDPSNYIREFSKISDSSLKISGYFLVTDLVIKFMVIFL